MLEEESRKERVSVSELIRRAIHRCYGPGRQLAWDQVFAHSVRVGAAEAEVTWVYDELFDDAVDEMSGLGSGKP